MCVGCACDVLSDVCITQHCDGSGKIGVLTSTGPDSTCTSGVEVMTVSDPYN